MLCLMIHDFNDDDAICNSCFSAAECLRPHIWALMFHNSLLGHKSVFTPHNLNAHTHQPLIEIYIVSSMSRRGSTTGIRENIHNTLWEKSRYANFWTIWPPQLLCMLSGGWDDFYVENTLHTFQNWRPYQCSPACFIHKYSTVSSQRIHILHVTGTLHTVLFVSSGEGGKAVFWETLHNSQYLRPANCP